MNATLFADVPFDSDEAWGAFQLQHGLAHQTVYEAMLRKTLAPTYFPLFDFPREESQEYLLDHYQTHASNATLLGLPGIPDLSTYDLSDAGQYRDFLALHAIVHSNENIVLGIT